ncbi:MAG TPA: hypothetical protein PLY87_05995 [Planctomycetaceae bacterium]|nr:hypothetical protein [Planctomycetaceae bacterium]HQZ64605.1 hypothetical protein [Planctomycetaceae bacterium]
MWIPQGESGRDIVWREIILLPNMMLQHNAKRQICRPSFTQNGAIRKFRAWKAKAEYLGYRTGFGKSKTNFSQFAPEIKAYGDLWN